MKLKKFLSFFIFILFFSETISWANSSTDFSYTQPPLFKWGFHQLPCDLAHDMKQSFWGVGGMVFVGGILTSAVLSKKDDRLITHFDDHPLFGKKGDDIFGLAGSPYTMAGLAVVGWGTGRLIKDDKFKMATESFLEAFFLTESITLLTKEAFRRDRPNGQSLGFPSAHTSGVFSLASVLEVMYGPAVGLPSYALASVVGLSRIDSKDHFVSDVVMGAFIGGVIGWGTAEFHKKRYLPVEISTSVSQNSYNLSIYRQF